MTLALPASASSSSPSAIVCASEAARRRPDQPIDVWCLRRSSAAGGADAFFAAHADRFDWAAPDGGCVAFPRYRGADGVEAMCHDLVEQAGVLLLPASLYGSDVGDVASDRFRIGVGRRDPGPALERFAAFLEDRA